MQTAVPFQEWRWEPEQRLRQEKLHRKRKRWLMLMKGRKYAKLMLVLLIAPWMTSCALFMPAAVPEQAISCTKFVALGNGSDITDDERQAIPRRPKERLTNLEEAIESCY